MKGILAGESNVAMENPVETPASMEVQKGKSYRTAGFSIAMFDYRRLVAKIIHLNLHLNATKIQGKPYPTSSVFQL